MADELNTPNHRYYQPQNNILLAANEVSKQFILASGIVKIDAKIINPLFALAEPGVWYDPSDLTTLFQDNAGTTPVTASGQTVGLMLDKSQGLVLGSELVTNGDFSGGLTGWTTGSAVTSSVVSGEAQITFAGNASQSGNNWFSQGSKLTSTTATYKVTFDATLVSGGALQVASGYDLQATISANTSKTTYSVYVKRGFSGTVGDQQTLVFAGAAGAVWKIDNISVKLLAGNHATQATSTQRPTYGINPIVGTRNLLTFTEQFDNAAWTKTNTTVSADNVSAPDGTLTADTATTTTASSLVSRGVSIPVDSTTYTASIYVKYVSGLTTVRLRAALTGGTSVAKILRINSQTGAFVASDTTYAITAVGGGWYRIAMQITNNGTNTLFNYQLYCTDDATSTNAIAIWGAQLEVSATATAYQKVVSQYEVTQAGVQSAGYLAFDGVDDGMVTGTITPSIDKVQVFAGVRKISDAARANIVEFGNAALNAWFINGPSGSGSDYYFGSAGSVSTFTRTVKAAPTTDVLTCIGDIANDIAIIRDNGTQVATSTANQGTGNYNALPLYIGRRGGSSLPYNGRLYSLITRFGANLTDGQITSTESWVNSKTGAY